MSGPISTLCESIKNLTFEEAVASFNTRRVPSTSPYKWAPYAGTDYSIKFTNTLLFKDTTTMGFNFRWATGGDLAQSFRVLGINTDKLVAPKCKIIFTVWNREVTYELSGDDSFQRLTNYQYAPFPITNIRIVDGNGDPLPEKILQHVGIEFEMMQVDPLVYDTMLKCTVGEPLKVYNTNKVLIASKHQWDL